MTYKREQNIQNQIRLALSNAGVLNFRANVGQGWTSSQRAIEVTAPMTVSLQPGDVLLRHARRFSTGLPVGFSDLVCITPVTITDDMVGDTMGVFTSIEVKREKQNPTPEQVKFQDSVRRCFGYAGVARSVQDALKIINK